MDVNAGRHPDGRRQPSKRTGARSIRCVLRVASGEASKSEAQGLGDYEFVPWQIGAVM